jgi:hypothetical protein
VKFKFRNALIAGVIYLIVLANVWAMGWPALIVFLLYVAGCMFIANQMIAGAESRQTQENTLEFSKYHPATVFGEEWKRFFHVFRSPESIHQEIIQRMTEALVTQLGCEPLKDTTVTDIDRDLPRPETRVFNVGIAPKTSRDSRFHFMCSLSRNLRITCVRWWVYVLGQRDPNKVFWRYALAPVQVPFVCLAYRRREFEPLHGLTSVDPGFFNQVDIATRTREIEFIAFETLIETLEAHGIDTSDLKLARANALTINVSGQGNASIGNIMQGAFGRFTGGGAKA